MKKSGTSRSKPAFFSFPVFLILIMFCFILLRFIHLPESIGFGSDAGRDFLEIWNIAQEREIKLIGPPSQYAVEGRYFYFGPAPYYIMLPGLIIGNWDVLFASKYLILLNALAVCISLVILNKTLKQKEKFLLYSYALFLTFTPLFINYSRTYWNPHFMLPLSIILLSLILRVRSSKLTPITRLIIGILFGVGMQFHYSFFLAIALTLSILLMLHKLNLKTIIFITVGSVIGFSPIILFELISKFYNIRTFFLFMSNMDNDSRLTGMPHYYFISLMPFFFYGISLGLMKLKQKHLLASLSLLIIYVMISLLVILPKPSHGYDMADNWNYPRLKKTADLIIQDNPQSFNIVDQLTGDNRAMALRYILTSQGAEPLGIEEYPASERLYVYTKEPLEVILRDPVWEIKSAEMTTHSKVGTIHDDIILYRLEK